MLIYLVNQKFLSILYMFPYLICLPQYVFNLESLVFYKYCYHYLRTFVLSTCWQDWAEETKLYLWQKEGALGRLQTCCQRGKASLSLTQTVTNYVTTKLLPPLNNSQRLSTDNELVCSTTVLQLASSTLGLLFLAKVCIQFTFEIQAKRLYIF